MQDEIIQFRYKLAPIITFTLPKNILLTIDIYLPYSKTFKLLLPTMSKNFKHNNHTKNKTQESPFLLSAISQEKTLYPIIKLDEPDTHSPWLDVDCQGIVIKAQHLLSKNGKRTNKIFDQISKSGGIHNFIGYPGTVILSSIMPDYTLSNFLPEDYARMIETLSPDYYITPDGETYLGEYARSSREINRMIHESERLIRLCPEYSPIGLVKGCTCQQNGDHTHALLDLGVTQFTFHASDYLRRGPAWVTDRAIYFAQVIRQKVPVFLVYGVGSMSSLQLFNFADGYITQSHFVNAYFGKKIFNENIDPTMRQKITRKDIMNILRRIKNDVDQVEDSRITLKDLSYYCNLFGTEHVNINEKILVRSFEEKNQTEVN
nr:hypothetical protein [uncultured Methanoregula sp.]